MASLYDLYKDDPRKALQVLFEQRGKNYEYHGNGPALFLSQGGKDKEGVRYGSYKYVYLRELETRQYEVEWEDYMPSIRYTDVVFNPKTGKYEHV